MSVYEQVVEAYICGLEDLVQTGGNVSKIASVASIFVSRIDTAIDKRLDKVGDQRVADRFRGRVAIANAKFAYARYKALFSGPRWQLLAASGAKAQRLLWASTSTKNPAYKDTMYVEALIGRDTVDTIPPATMDAFRDHGKATPDAIEQDVAGARAMLAELEEHGVSLKEVTEELVKDGVQQFADAFDKLFGTIAQRRRALLEGGRVGLKIGPGSPGMEAAFEEEMEVWRKDGCIRRLWAGDKSLWSGTDEGQWAGWLHVVEIELANLDRLHDFAKEVKQRGFTDVVLMGMGGSSLGPEVLGETFGRQSGWPRFHMLDSTDPAQIKAIERAVDLAKTLFIVSSKSGSTLEPNIFMEYFLDRISAVRGTDKAGEHFVAVTDPGSPLEQRAKQLRFAHIFHGVPSIGGRYSVLSKFGLVPAAAMGLDFKRLLETPTQPMECACGPDVPPAENPGVQLGIAIGVAATRFGRDKVTIIASPGIADLGAWLEQLLAESTGKHGRGLIPLAGEPLTTPGRYGSDRFFAYLEMVVKALGEKPRAVWVMLPAGRITEETVERLGGLLEPDDIIIDGGNSFYKDDIRRAKKLAEKRIRYVDCGTSGGVWGIERGYCMMIGGSKEAVDHVDPIFAALAPGLGDIPRTPGRKTGDPRAERGYIHAGPSGAGHFVKMVHNGIEYGLMQAYAEGFDIFRNKDSKDLPEDERFALNMPDIAEVWRRGSVISSWLLDLGAAALAKDPQLKDFSGYVQDSGEGGWTVEAAIEEAVPADVLSTALYARFRSRHEHTFGEKMLSAMRFGFGGHIEGNESIDPEPKPAELQDRSAAQSAAD